MVEPPESRPTMMQTCREADVAFPTMGCLANSNLIYVFCCFVRLLPFNRSIKRSSPAVYVCLSALARSPPHFRRARGLAGISHSPPNRASPRVWHHRPPLGPSECHLSSIERSGRDLAIFGMTSVPFRWKVDEIIFGNHLPSMPFSSFLYVLSIS